MMALPVINSRMETLDGLFVFGTPLCLIDFIRDAFSGLGSTFELVKVCVGGW